MLLPANKHILPRTINASNLSGWGIEGGPDGSCPKPNIKFVGVNLGALINMTRGFRVKRRGSDALPGKASKYSLQPQVPPSISAARPRGIV